MNHILKKSGGYQGFLLLLASVLVQIFVLSITLEIFGKNLLNLYIIGTIITFLMVVLSGYYKNEDLQKSYLAIPITSSNFCFELFKSSGEVKYVYSFLSFMYFCIVIIIGEILWKKILKRK